MTPTILTLTTAAAAGAVTTPPAAWVLGRAAAPIPALRAAGLVAAGVAAVTAWWLAGAWPGWWLPVPVVLTVVAVPLALADLRHLRLPDVLTLPAYPLSGAAIGAAALGGGGPSLAVRAAAGALLFGGAHALVARAAPGSLGAGDVKLSGSLGAVLGAAGWPALATAPLLAALFTLALAAAQKVQARRRWSTGPRWPTNRRRVIGLRAPNGPRRATGPRPTCWRCAPDQQHPTARQAAHQAHPTATDLAARLPHGPALLTATWLCALFPAAL
ncbi:prepilin peptidase [Amycolatopsis sp. cmx-4-68]|uniref:prepilin peptidase n=1 Tax=Amycolatopsis sp. cmx-4-68 TaxID=2790938 RepID=UPI00397804C7